MSYKIPSLSSYTNTYKVKGNAQENSSTRKIVILSSIIVMKAIKQFYRKTTLRQDSAEIDEKLIE